MATKIVNMTPHVLNIHTPNGEKLTISPFGLVARVAQTTRDEGMVEVEVDGVVKKVGISLSSFGEVEYLPEPQTETIFVVSGMVLAALQGARPDVMAPGELIRNEQGQPIGCRGLRR